MLKHKKVNPRINSG